MNIQKLKKYNEYAEIGAELISKIPRMELISDIIRNQNKKQIEVSKINQNKNVLGATILQISLEFDRLINTAKITPEKAVNRVARSFTKDFELKIIAALKAVITKYYNLSERKISIKDLLPGHILSQDIHKNDGTLLLSAGQKISKFIVKRLISQVESEELSSEVCVYAGTD